MAGQRVATVLAALAVSGAWAVYLPLGLQYIAVAACAVAATVALRQGPGWRRSLSSPLMTGPIALWLLLLASSLWTVAPAADVRSHLFHYGLLLLVPLIGFALPAAAARRGLRHFVYASALVGILIAIEAAGLLPATRLWTSTAHSTGNQRIATSLLLALGTTIALLMLADRPLPTRARLAWLALAAAALVGLTLQDRRTGMAVLPLLLAAVALARRPSWRLGSALLAGVLLLSAALWQASPTVRERFAEGVSELQSYERVGEVRTSWGMRLRMAQHSLEMVADRPLFGHGVGSWLTEWRERSRGGGSLVEDQLTPHNEHLLLASQLGLVGLALWLAVITAYLAHAWRSRPAGGASLVVWTAIACSAFFNVVLRDAKFALPLLMLAALALAASRNDTTGQTQPLRSG